MSIRTTITPVTGVLQTGGLTGLQITADANNKGFGPFQVLAVTSYISTSVSGNSPQMYPGEAGVCTLSGSGAVLGAIAPLASSCPGAMFIVRSVDARAHTITGSLESQGRRVFTNGTTLGSKLTFDGTVGTSIKIMSDGLSWLVTSGSGSVTFSGA